MNRVPFLLLLLLAAGLAAQSVHAQFSAMGAWEFDPARRDLYIASVRANQSDTRMSEIAIQMGMATIQNSIYHFGADRTSGPYLKITDRTTQSEDVQPLVIRFENGVMVITQTRTGNVLRLTPVDKDRITLRDEAKKVDIPLKRR